jgi:hypothetical protein
MLTLIVSFFTRAALSRPATARYRALTPTLTAGG